MADRNTVARALSLAFLDGPWEAPAMIERAEDVLGMKHRKWVKRLIGATFKQFPNAPGLDVLRDYILGSAALRAAYQHSRPPRIVRWRGPEPKMQPSLWRVPELTTFGELAAWLDVPPRELAWLADIKGMNRTAPSQLNHYHRGWLPKRSQGFRLIERPKPKLAKVQRQLLRGILERIPVHPAAHGFVKGRSPSTFAAQHAGNAVVLRLDLEDFFGSVHCGRVYRTILSAGYPFEVALAIASMCTTAVPPNEWRTAPRPHGEAELSSYQRLREHALRRHLPQGAPTSPALANLCAYHLDARLEGAARAAGANYARYADDIAFSGGTDFARRASRFVPFAAGIALDEGFRVNFRKTRMMAQSVRQELVGLVVNSTPNVKRESYDRLKAILTNCVRTGPTPQNREEHADFRAVLEGHIAHVGQHSLARRKKLKRLFEQIDWTR